MTEVALIKSDTGASGTCPTCGTVYDLHAVDISDYVPPYGDGCDDCDPRSEEEE